MTELLEKIKVNFADHADIIAKVGNRASYLMELQDSVKPYIAYIVRQSEPTSKDLRNDYDLRIAIVATEPLKLIEIFETVRTVFKIRNNDYRAYFMNSSFPEVMENEDSFIMEVEYQLVSSL